jgi:FKBP-type peptidyl-prolyl cis-trans isomerase FkpA
VLRSFAAADLPVRTLEFLMFRYRTWPASGRGVSLVALALVVAGCSSNNPTAPPWVVSVPFSSSDVVAGTGDEAIVGKVVVVDYAGWLYNASMAESKGPLFDTSFNRDVFSFELGAGAVIRGWDQGVAGMKVGRPTTSGGASQPCLRLDRQRADTSGRHARLRHLPARRVRARRGAAGDRGPTAAAAAVRFRRSSV